MDRTTDNEQVDRLHTHRMTEAEYLQWRWECEYGTEPPVQTITLEFLPEQNLAPREQTIIWDVWFSAEKRREQMMRPITLPTT